MRKTVHPETCPPRDCCPADAGLQAVRLTEPEAEQRLADLCRALGHSARIRILRVLLEKDVCVAGELAGQVDLAPSTVSQHLKILKEAGLIKGEVDGPRRCYCADKSIVAQLRSLVRAL